MTLAWHDLSLNQLLSVQGLFGLRGGVSNDLSGVAVEGRE